MDPAWRDVTLRLLLAHRAGAPAGLDAGGLWGRLWVHPGTPREQRRTLVADVLTRPPDPAPGTRYVYSNAGYALAGAMLETLADTPWERLLQREVFQPLGMDAVGFGAPGTPGELDQPLGHHATADGPRPQPLGPGDDNPAAIGPGGTVHASLEAWARFVAAHLRGAQGEHDFLEAASWRTLHTPLEGQDYALGWVVAERGWAGGTALTHSGSNTMWFCTAWLAVERGFAVLAAANVGGDDAARACDSVCAALIGDWLERSEEPR
jgi:CubicO group peptidase (beta-lactamase class C family)